MLARLPTAPAEPEPAGGERIPAAEAERASRRRVRREAQGGLGMAAKFAGGAREGEGCGKNLQEILLAAGFEPCSREGCGRGVEVGLLVRALKLRILITWAVRSR